MRLKQSLNTSNKFERNRIDKFILEAAEIGKVNVTVSLDITVSMVYAF